MTHADADAGALRQFISFAKTSGLDLDRILDRELRSIATAAPQAERVPAHAIVDMLQICSVVTRRSNLGIALAQWGNIRGNSPLSLLWDHCPTLADAIRVNSRFAELESKAITTSLDQQIDEVAIRHLLLVPARYGGSQFIESVLLLATRLGRLILGEGWSPVRIEFQHSAPEDYALHRQLFRCPIEFGADRSAVIISRDDIDRPTQHGNAHLLAFLERHLETVRSAEPVDFVGQVDQLIAANLTSGEAMMDHVAKLLRVSRRTLQRGLEQKGTSFTLRLDAARRRVVDEYFRTEKRPNLNLLAYRLGYSEASAASRYLRKNMGLGIRKIARPK
ncbi:AraC family transcriptional regulator [Sphingobium chlorophenolicum]|uniref:AraC family transcriptional regulator n=1 Tax=Sphingobium chlorophenolicum TaxID=46429 RepID=A0A081RB28_SPHCR|nr:AraC family transcriptional regulator ligand-binding domain-containing protein [Sphingobium chlorophenolicum]KEQ52401.1 AraC family transcriptional regulator [Sphingobium chlorophenolicum]